MKAEALNVNEPQSFLAARRVRPKGEVSVIKIKTKYWDFVTGLTGKLAGKEGTPEDSSVYIETVIGVSVFEGHKVDRPEMFYPLLEAPYHNVIECKLFQCCEFLSWLAGTYDSKTLLEMGRSNSLGIPKEFTVETWKPDERLKWRLNSKTHWKGVRWLDAAHTGDGGDRMCAGVATFLCDEKVVEDVVDGEVVVLKETKYPESELIYKLVKE